MKGFFKSVIAPVLTFCILFFPLTVIITSCGSDDNGGECSKCDSGNRNSCNEGLSCYMFSNGESRCGKSGSICDAFGTKLN